MMTKSQYAEGALLDFYNKYVVNREKEPSRFVCQGVDDVSPEARRRYVAWRKNIEQEFERDFPKDDVLVAAFGLGLLKGDKWKAKYEATNPVAFRCYGHCITMKEFIGMLPD